MNDSPEAIRLNALMMLGMWAQDDAAAEAKVAQHRRAFASTVERLTPTALEAMTDLLAAEWRKRYGDDDEVVSSHHRHARRNEVRPRTGDAA